MALEDLGIPELKSSVEKDVWALSKVFIDKTMDVVC